MLSFHINTQRRHRVETAKPMDTLLGHVQFSDGSRQPVYEDAAGRQYLLDEHGERVHGDWLVPDADEPMIVEQKARN